MEPSADAARAPAVAEIPHFDTRCLHADAIRVEADTAPQPGSTVLGVPGDEVLAGTMEVVRPQHESPMVKLKRPLICIVAGSVDLESIAPAQVIEPLAID